MRQGSVRRAGRRCRLDVPGVLPGPFFELELEDLPKVGDRKAEPIRKYGIESLRGFYNAALSRVRNAYGSVDGERKVVQRVEDCVFALVGQVERKLSGRGRRRAEDGGAAGLVD